MARAMLERCANCCWSKEIGTINSAWNGDRDMEETVSQE